MNGDRLAHGKADAVAPPARLRDGADPREPSARWAVSLVRGAGPYEPDLERQQRVWANLRGSHPRGRGGRLRLALAATLLVLAGLGAGAALAQWPGWLARIFNVAVAPERRSAESAGTSAKPPTAAPAVPLSAQQVPEPAAPPSASAAEAASARASGRLTRGPSGPSAEESQLLLEAMRALRMERNPDKARHMLSTYLARHRTGALAEEALVMLVEAAVDRGDSDAADLAARYFSLYPKGGFREQVQRTIAGAARPRP